MTRGLHISVVALVCSAGGLDAVSRVLGQLPDGFPAAVIVLQHHDPHARNMLASILRNRTVLPVATAHDGDPLVSGRVLVAPAGYHTLVTAEGTVALIESGDWPPYHPSADLLLTSLALAAGRHAIAVVLSGYGNDGATGATAVHRFGGVVIASDPATSPIAAMPQAVINRDEIVDHIAAVDEIAALLVTLASPVVRESGSLAGIAPG